MTEDTDIATRVQITADRTALYGIDLPDGRMVPLLEALMRTYTGIFSYPVTIDEDYIAARCGVSVPEDPVSDGSESPVFLSARPLSPVSSSTRL